MIAVGEADKIIAAHLSPFPVTEKLLTDCYGLILREDLSADRDLPPFDKALMDGIAIKASAYQKGVRKFTIQGIQAAGQPALKITRDDACTEIMTGAVLTEGCDCVVPIEQIQMDEDTAILPDGMTLKAGQFVRHQGADHRQDEVLLQKGCQILSPQTALAAAIGKSRLKVYDKPKVAIITNGDELVDIDADVKPFQIRKSNSYFIRAALEATHFFETQVFYFKDNKQDMLDGLGGILKNFDVLVATGGVSMGKFDYVPEVLRKLGVEVLFHKVQQKPGKPFWFGRSKEGKPVFALPGNPVSTQVGTVRYVIKHLKKILGLSEQKEYAVLKQEYQFEPSLTCFCPVKINCNPLGQWEAEPVSVGGSGDFASIAKSQGFIELPSDQSTFLSGFKARLYRWDQ